MEKLKILPLGMVCIYFCKVMILNALSLNDAIGLLSLCSLAAIFEIMDKRVSNTKMVQEFSSVKEEMLKSMEHRTKDIDDLKSSLASVKIGQGFKQVNRTY